MLVCVIVIRICSSNLYEVPTASYMNMLNEGTIDINQTPLSLFGYNETEGDVDGGGEEGDDEADWVSFFCIV